MEKRQKHPRHPATGRPGQVGEPAGEPVSELSLLRFAQLARQMAPVVREYGLEPPSFRSPPRIPGVSRSIKRHGHGSATVSVALRGRPAVAVVADMIDGVIAANRPVGSGESPAGLYPRGRGRDARGSDRRGGGSAPPAGRAVSPPIPAGVRDRLWAEAVPYLVPAEVSDTVAIGHRRAA